MYGLATSTTSGDELCELVPCTCQPIKPITNSHVTPAKPSGLVGDWRACDRTTQAVPFAKGMA